ncbi:type II secretion system inner membrane protein GspF [uncultured Thiothrix sp.]|uniref:type II secretion system inner membrane protein GspF n=1 Tax=uncultured Thiothrix sp. TaxID=223185 RepID=UPI00261305D1|nr:type II secretion system inner membrane protein GspF [uncultured Thiothrix sp.]HMT94172.1 type II secretion system inner membrane protein GspF [Thiolinea sp.]
MPAFEYVALNTGGREEKGILEADTARQVRQLLRNSALTPLEINEVVQKQKKSEGARLFGGSLNKADLALMTRQLATLVSAGSPLEEALGTISRQSEHRSARRIFSAIRSRVMEGHTLASSLGQFPAAFPVLYRATVGAGEQSGHLAQVLERLADYTENSLLNQQKVSTAFIYPALLALVAVGIVIALLKFVVPNVISVFDTFDGDLPTLTQMLIASSNFLENHGITLLIAIIGFVIFVRYLLKFPSWKRRSHRLMLKLPLVGRLVRGINTEHFARTLSILASSGVPILDALKIAGGVITNIPMREAVDEATVKVREGMAINKALQQSGYFPPMVIYLIASGEGSGQLDQMLERAAIQQERETQSRITKMVGLLEPLLILVMGGAVTAIVLAIMLPILKMPQFIR